MAPERRHVSRAGLKLEHALEHFDLDVSGFRCADFGCNVGGFTDCLLQRGAAHVIAIDTGHNVLAYSLRRDERVTVHERTNALHMPPPAPEARVDLVVIDMAWTRQQLAIPAALAWLRPTGRIVTLVKPHYELEPSEKDTLLDGGRLDHGVAADVCRRTLDALHDRFGVIVHGSVQSPLTGGKSAKKGPGNIEFTALLGPPPASAEPRT